MNETTMKEIYTFSKGLPGFEELKAFEIQQHDEVFSLLTAVDNPAISFITINPFDFKVDYEFELSPENVDELSITDPGQVLVRSIITIHSEMSKSSANLLAPVVFNREKKLGKQIVLQNTDYRTKHYLWKREEEGGEV
ncbi:flagellar assembly protein FliW [Paenibacillus sp. FSL W8-0426]|uniref:flagellar assembly protein FliW n=1 Tax=Paenibacillus sp. FSL W8-0426 TaxID=2921714 RepID=UPI0030DB4D8A